MSDRLKSLREKRGVAVKEMRDIISAAENEKRDLSAEELQKHTKAFNVVEGLREQIEAEERTQESERRQAETEARALEAGRAQDKGKPLSKDDLMMAGFRTYLRTGGFTGEGGNEFRAFQAGSDTEGGFVVAPQQVVQTILKGVDNQTFIRDRATKYQLPAADSLGVPTMDNDAGDLDWTQELKTGNEENSLKIGKRELRPHPMAKLIKISKTLLRKAPQFEGLVMDRMSYKVGVTAEKAYLVGDGQQKPLGVFVASTDGIPTSRDVAAGNTNTAITFDGLTAAKYSVKAQYWGKSDWLFHRDAVKNLTLIKDTVGQYIWRMSVRDGEPDTLLGRPLMISEYCPNTFTTGLYVGMFGDFSNYWIVDALNFQVQRLVELYATTNQDGFIGRYEGDGAPALAEAFARVTLT